MLKIVQSMARIGPFCTLHFAEKEIKFITRSDAGGVEVWTTLSKDIFFRNYQVASKYHDQINMDVQTDMIVSALKSAADSPAITMRLGKRGASPHLAFSILTDVNGTESKNGNKARAEIQHEVLIRLMKPDEWEALVEPQVSRPQVSIRLPKLSKIRTVTERFNRMGFATLHCTADSQGMFALGCTNERGAVQVVWKGLATGLPALGPTQHSQGELTCEEIDLDIKSFMRFLSSHAVESHTLATFLPDDRCAVFLVYVGDQPHGTVMSFYIPMVTAD